MDEDTNPKDRLGIKKTNLFLVPPVVEILAARAFEVGAAKYGPYNWRTKRVLMSIYIAAMKRHLDRIIDGQDAEIDPKVPELGEVDHLGNIIACAGIIADARSIGKLIDDRPPRGKAAEILDGYDRSINAASPANREEPSSGSDTPRTPQQD